MVRVGKRRFSHGDEQEAVKARSDGTGRLIFALFINYEWIRSLTLWSYWVVLLLGHEVPVSKYFNCFVKDIEYELWHFSWFSHDRVEL